MEVNPVVVNDKFSLLEIDKLTARQTSNQVKETVQKVLKNNPVDLDRLNDPVAKKALEELLDKNN